MCSLSSLIKYLIASWKVYLKWIRIRRVLSHNSLGNNLIKDFKTVIFVINIVHVSFVLFESQILKSQRQRQFHHRFVNTFLLEEKGPWK